MDRSCDSYRAQLNDCEWLKVPKRTKTRLNMDQNKQKETSSVWGPVQMLWGPGNV